MLSREQKRAGRSELHYLDAEGAVACNPRDREAAHRAEMSGIATERPAAVTCRKCIAVMHAARREDRRRP